jgi:2-polyprenyl-6-methoxyphenol hydroxylase-like FAD-dependent oxidoreductase
VKAGKTRTRVDVLVVGAGPVGLAAAIELGQRGVSCLVVEQHERVGVAPRAKTTNVRTREHLRRWGIAAKLAAASPLGVDYPSNIVFATRLTGFELCRFENASYCAPGKNPLYSEHGQWIPQYELEKVLKAHAESLPGVHIQFGRRLESLTQDESGVRARVGEETIECRYLIGADGSRSTVRSLVGAVMSGATLGRHCNTIFRAPGISRAHALGPATMYWLVNADAPSVTGPMDKDDTWFFGATLPEGRTLEGEGAKQLIRQATGVDLPIELLSNDEWVAHRLIADRYRDRRVFLAGDACHVHPPFGGYGMNMGIADAVDLGWKIAALLQGWGGPRLLESYEAERRPVHEFVMDEAVANHALLPKHLWQPGLDDATPDGARLRAEVGAAIRAAKVREFNTLGVVLGYNYSGSPIVVGDGSTPPPRHFRDYVPSAHPGCLAPHAWLADGSSLYDHFGAGFTLLVTEGSGAPGVDTRVPLKVLRESSIRDLYQARYALIRPDQHVAWRGDSLPQGVFERITGGANRE